MGLNGLYYYKLMKIYIPDIKINNLDLSIIKQYLYKTNKNSFIYSHEGIFKIKNNKIYLQNIQSKPAIYNKIDNIDCIIDNSVISYNDEHWQIPFNHIYREEIYDIYHLRKNAIVDLVIEKFNENISDIYFLTKDDINILNINKDILTFLSLLKFY
tara:strand:- start:203 stop:670 length:468 start_codon:yes stop_codon:yes gene_type:complete